MDAEGQSSSVPRPNWPRSRTLLVAAVVVVIVIGAALALAYSPGGPLRTRSSGPSLQKLPSANYTLPGAPTITEADIVVNASVPGDWSGWLDLVLGSPVPISFCVGHFGPGGVGGSSNYTSCRSIAALDVYNVTSYNNCLDLQQYDTNYVNLAVIVPSQVAGVAVGWHVYFNSTSTSGCGAPGTVDYDGGGFLYPTDQALLAEYPDQFTLPSQFSNVEIWVNSSEPTSIFNTDFGGSTTFSDHANGVYSFSGETTFQFSIGYYYTASFAVSVQALVY
jgi:hypothetical protein